MMTEWSHYSGRVSSPKIRPGPEGGKRDRNRRETVRRLADVALKLFLADGTEAVSIDQIVLAADMAKGSFYRYAHDKADLVEQIMSPVMDEVIVALDRCERALDHAQRDSLATVYFQLATELSVIVARHPRHVLLYLQEVRAPSTPARRTFHVLADRLMARTVELTRIARDHDLIRDVDPELAALNVLGVVDTLLFAYLRKRRAPSGEIPKIIVELVDVVLRGIRR